MEIAKLGRKIWFKGFDALRELSEAKANYCLLLGLCKQTKSPPRFQSSNQRGQLLDEVFPNERRPRCPVGATLSLWRQDVAAAVPRWPPSSAISHILPSAQQFCPATSLPRLMPKTAGGLLHAGREEEAEAATVDPNGSKCAPVPFNHRRHSTSCVIVGILLTSTDNRLAGIPAGASALNGLAGKSDGQMKEERRFCFRCRAP